MARVLMILLLLITAGFAATFFISHEFDVQEAHLVQTNAAIRSERDRYRVLRAEWASLNDPARLEETLRAAQSLAPELLLTPTTGEQFLVDLALIPERIKPGTPVPDMPLPLARPFNRTPTQPEDQRPHTLPETGGVVLVKAQGVAM